MKKILLITTGGTIASGMSDNGLIPELSGQLLLSYVPELEHRYEIETLEVLNLDSSNIQPEEWKIIAKSIYDRLDASHAFDGIIVTHGTDTMAYTASMLTFILQNLNKPVVLTGSQLPITDSETDAIANLRDSFLVASSNIKGGVYIVFNGKVMLGCRASKVRTTSADAFESINFGYVGKVENGLYILNEYFGGSSTRQIKYDDAFDPNVFLLKLIPGTRTEFFSEFVKMGYKGIVIESFGSGGFHYIRRDMPEALTMLTNRGIAVVVISQCRYESSDLLKYEVGRKTLEAGVIPGHDMTAEAAVTKLMWVLAHADGKKVQEMMQKNFCDEIRRLE